jgi:hypothetical protein
MRKWLTKGDRSKTSGYGRHMECSARRANSAAWGCLQKRVIIGKVKARGGKWRIKRYTARFSLKHLVVE